MTLSESREEVLVRKGDFQNIEISTVYANHILRVNLSTFEQARIFFAVKGGPAALENKKDPKEQRGTQGR